VRSLAPGRASDHSCRVAITLIQRS
jgi:hypothetical protein